MRITEYLKNSNCWNHTSPSPLSADILSGIIDYFARQNIVFTNESQFQHRLAIALQELGYEVELEVLSLSVGKNQKREKIYTDIVVKENSGSYIAIELKYKTTNKNIIYDFGDRKYYTFNQGAENIGRYAFCEDIERIERLLGGRKYKDPGHQDVVFNLEEKKITRGFAIIVTNEQLYSAKDRKQDNISSAFYIGDDIELTGELSWKNDSSTDAIHLDGSYVCNWHDYDLQKTPKCAEIMFVKNSSYIDKKKTIDYDNCRFKYMIIEIPTQGAQSRN